MKNKVVTNKVEILNFLLGISPDHKGRMFADILALTDEQLEECHDQIQWIFPLHEESKHATVSPILTEEITEVAKKDPTIVGNMIFSKRRMEKFLGIEKWENPDRQKQWCKNGNHNLLRVTRIIRSLRLLGLDDEAYIFFLKVTKIAYDLNVSKTTLMFWNNAMFDDPWDSMQGKQNE